jgi:two-component system response regulator MprA
MNRFVCVIDDDADIREALYDVLTFEGYEVQVASDGAEALERLRTEEESCGLILLDLMMPRMNGWEFRRKQVEDPSLESIPVVLLTGAGGCEKVASDLKVAAAIEKPVELDALLEVVARYCAPNPPERH